MSPEEALRDNEKYEVVWQVLQALRSHDERLAPRSTRSTSTRSRRRSTSSASGSPVVTAPTNQESPRLPTAHPQMTLDLPDLGRVARRALRTHRRQGRRPPVHGALGEGHHRHRHAARTLASAPCSITRTRTPLQSNVRRVPHSARNNLNDGVTRDDAISMLSQHLITRPVFEALFDGDDFTKRNPVSPGDAVDDRHARRREPRRRDRNARRVLCTHPDARRRDRLGRGTPEGHRGAVRTFFKKVVPKKLRRSASSTPRSKSSTSSTER